MRGVPAIGPHTGRLDVLLRRNPPTEQAGFRTVRALREAGHWLGRVCDEVVMDALAAEFTGPSAVTPLMTE
ncbi:hypothetical protein [Kitasatospora sp. NPDC056184]|uniref:hypothetical protein n=1 Tax=Kitasatospora sp. NPDC056184 TaxID=3345738 RepID=UPI0035D6E492